MARKAELTREFVQSILKCDPEQETYTWKYNKDKAKNWNSRYVGKSAVHYRGRTAYIAIHRRLYKVEVIKHLLETGEYNEILYSNGKAWTPEEEQLMHKLRAKGASFRKIAEALDRSPSAIRCKFVGPQMPTRKSHTIELPDEDPIRVFAQSAPWKL